MLYPGKAYEALDVLSGDSINNKHMTTSFVVIHPKEIYPHCLYYCMAEPNNIDPNRWIYLVNYISKTILPASPGMISSVHGVIIHRQPREEEPEEEPRIQFLFGKED